MIDMRDAAGVAGASDIWPVIDQARNTVAARYGYATPEDRRNFNDSEPRITLEIQVELARLVGAQAAASAARSRPTQVIAPAPAITDPNQIQLVQLRRLVDVVLGHAAERGTMLGTDDVDRLIARALRPTPPPLAADARDLGADADLNTWTPKLAGADDTPPDGHASWKAAALAERQRRVTSERQRGLSTMRVAAAIEPLRAIRAKLSDMSRERNDTERDLRLLEACGLVDTAIDSQPTEPVPGDAVRYRRLREIGCCPTDNVIYLKRTQLDSFIDMNLLTNPGDEEPAVETPAEGALRAIASFLGIGGYNAPIVDAAKFRDKITDEIDKHWMPKAFGPWSVRDLVKAAPRAQPAGRTPAALRQRLILLLSRLTGTPLEEWTLDLPDAELVIESLGAAASLELPRAVAHLTTHPDDSNQEPELTLLDFSELPAGRHELFPRTTLAPAADES